LLHRFLHPGITAFGLRFTTLGGKYPRLVFHQLDMRHARRTNKKAAYKGSFRIASLYLT